MLAQQMCMRSTVLVRVPLRMPAAKKVGAESPFDGGNTPFFCMYSVRVYVCNSMLAGQEEVHFTHRWFDRGLLQM